MIKDISVAPGRLRLASFNVALNRPRPGRLIRELATPGAPQPAALAAIIQQVRPDVLLLNEIDYDAQGRALAYFCDHYLARPQQSAAGLSYPYRHAYPSNTGRLAPVAIGADPGVAPRLPGDGLGYGEFPGQYAFALLSRLPFSPERARSLRRLRWRRMPDSLLTAAGLHPAAAAVLPLSSKNHVDQPLRLPGGGRLHLLLSHPAPPISDGGRGLNRLRNHDEIRLLSDYISPGRDRYIVDDRGRRGGLPRGGRFVILGDLNADPEHGDGIAAAIVGLLRHPRVHSAAAVGRLRPRSAGGAQLGRPYASAGFGGGLRVDYVLPAAGLQVCGGGVFWPPSAHPARPLVENELSSDHRLVWLDFAL